MRKILVAGATGIVGSEVVKLLREKNYKIKTLSRSAERAESLRGSVDEIATGDATDAKSLEGVLDGVDAVISSLGAPVSFKGSDRRSFREVDTKANCNLIAEAKKAGVNRFVYVSVHVQDGYAYTDYIRAHEAVVEELRRSGVSFGVVRPTGIFPIFDQLVEMARSGIVSFGGDGKPLTNPVHPADVAEACVEMLKLESGASVSVGGPDVLTRDEMALMAFAAVGKKPRIVHLPRSVLLLTSKILKPFHPRLGEVIEFATEVIANECLAPKRGKRRFADYLEASVKNFEAKKSLKKLAT